MSTPSTPRFIGATTTTALVAFLLLVPTALHLADPAFGQGSGSGGGYSVVVEVDSGTNVNVNTPIGSVSAGQDVTVTFNLPLPESPLELTDLLQVGTTQREEALTNLLAQPKVTGVRISSGVDADDVRVTVQEFVPTDSALADVIPSAPGTGVANIILRVNAPLTEEGATGQTQEYRALKILEIKAPGIPKGGVSSATISFRLTQAEIDALGLATSDIQLLHLVDGNWEALETRFVSSEGGVLLFEADTPSFSYFAVASRQATTEESISETGSSALTTLGVVLGIMAIVAIGAGVYMKTNRKP